VLQLKTAAELMTPELEARWATRRALRESAVLRRIFREFLADGGPVPIDRLAAAFPDRPPAEIREHLAELDAQDLIQLGPEGVAIAYPFSASPTAFAVRLADGRQRHACCALDALGMAPMLGQSVRIRSECHHCRAPLALSADPTGPAPDADGITVWIGSRSEACRLATGL
jgi:hypothetical protein